MSDWDANQKLVEAAKIIAAKDELLNSLGRIHPSCRVGCQATAVAEIVAAKDARIAELEAENKLLSEDLEREESMNRAADEHIELIDGLERRIKKLEPVAEAAKRAYDDWENGCGLGEGIDDLADRLRDLDHQPNGSQTEPALDP